jgi:hypothetical protein
VLASALLLAAGAAGSGPVIAADDPNLVQLHSPCHQALVGETGAANMLKGPNATPEDARRTLQAVTRALDWNNKACAKIAGRTAEENAVHKQMHDLNAAFLHSLRAQADTVLHSRFEASDYAMASRELSACIASATLPQDVRRDCQTQLAYNRATQSGSTAAAGDPCDAALTAANDAGNALKPSTPKNYANFEKAYLRASDGLAANASCRRQQMHDVNSAYLLSWKAVADRYLDVPYTSDRDVPNAADPFAVPNDLFRKCNSSVPLLPLQVRTDCTEQLATNLRFLIDYASQPAPLSGQVIQPLNWQQIDWPYSLRPDFVWDGPCKNSENARCADEEVRDGNGPNGWGPVPGDRVTAVPIEGDRERVLFATIRNCDDLRRLFTGQPPQITCDFFNDTAAHKSSILLVVAQHKPNQQCGMNIDRVQSVGTPSTANPPRDAVRLNYTLTCTPPAAGSPGSTAMKVVSIPGGNANGAFANVTFVQSGGGGPSSATP